MLTLAQRIELWVTAVKLEEVVDHLGGPENRGLGGIVGDHLESRLRRRARGLWWTCGARSSEWIWGRPRGVPSQRPYPWAAGRCISEEVPSCGIVSGRRCVDECAGQMAHRRRGGHVGYEEDVDGVGFRTES